MRKELPKSINLQLDETLEKRLNALTKADCFKHMGKYLARQTNELLKNSAYKNGSVLVRICDDSEIGLIRDKQVSELGSDVDYGDDDPNRGFEGKKMYFFNLDKSLEDGVASTDFVRTLNDRFNRVMQIHNARAQEGLESVYSFDRPCFAIVVLPESVKREYASQISFGKTSAYNNKSGGSSMCKETVFSPEVLAHCGVATCTDLWTELRLKMVDNPYFYKDILESGSDLLKDLTLDIINEIEKEKELANIPAQARENLNILKTCLDTESLMGCLRWYCSSETYKGFSAESFLNLAIDELGLDGESAEVANLRVLATKNDAEHLGSSEEYREDALDYSDSTDEDYDEYDSENFDDMDDDDIM